jgi:homoserine O-acetyltransferase
MMFRLTGAVRLLAFAFLALLVVDASAGEVGLVEKRVFTLPSYTTVAGATIRNVRVGYETYGRLNPAGDNAIFVPHYYSGTSHAAGRYAESDVAPGYWNAIIGPGKALDTDRYFVISADTLVNLNVKDPQVTTTGPASIDPDTGRPYGMRFPVVAQRDSVRVHKALVDSLGVSKLVAVAGASGGSIQAMEWGALYPGFVERIVHVIGPGFGITPYVIAMIDIWNTPIRLDPKWNGGDYYGREEPLDGVAQALKIVTLTARGWGWADRVFGYQPADAARPPGEAVGNSFQIEAALNQAGAARAAVVDANNMLYMSKANQLYQLTDKEVAGIKAKILFVPAASDLLFPPELSERALERFRVQGGRAELFILQGDGGHLDGLFEVGQAADTIRRFIESE